MLQDSWFVECADSVYFSWLACSVLSLDECQIKINYGRFCVCFRCLERVILWGRLCGVVSMFIWFCYLEWMIYGGKLIWCDLLTSKMNQVEGTVFYIYIFIYFYYVGEICTSITPTNSRAKWEDYMKAWNYITIDFHQEMGQEYSTIVQIIVKADRGKAIAWRSVSWKMTCYHTSNEKKSLDSQSAFCTHSAVWSRLIRHFRSALILSFPFIRM